MKSQIVLYFLTATMALACIAESYRLLPTGTPERVSYHIHSASSGRLLAAFRGGRVHANATSTSKSKSSYNSKEGLPL